MVKCWGKNALLKTGSLKSGVRSRYRRILVEAVGGVGAVGGDVSRGDAVADVVVLVGVFGGVCRRGLRRVGDNAPYQLGGRGELVADLE